MKPIDLPPPSNWNKNALLRFIASSLEKMGIEANTVRRPHFLDDPKCFLSVVFFLGSLLLVIFAWLIKETEQHISTRSNGLESA